MCRNIKVLRRAGASPTQEELDLAALQFVRKVSGFHKPSRANQPAFDVAVREISASTARLLGTLTVAARPAASASSEGAPTKRETLSRPRVRGFNRGR